MADPPPPSQAPLGGTPPPPLGEAFAQLPRVPSAGSSSSRRPTGRTGYPPVSAGLVRSSSTGSVSRGDGYAAGGGSASPPGEAGGRAQQRNPSREQLEPLTGGPPAPVAADRAVTPRERSGSLSRLTPLPLVPLPGGAPEAGGGSGRSGRGGSGRAGSGRSAGNGVVPPLELPAASAGAADATHPPPQSVGERVAKKAAAATSASGTDDANADTARGPVKWVPHTHANPKHAKFCFICLHGKLEGQKDGVDDQVRRQKADDDDLPSPVDMKKLGYLLPPGGEFRRASADYENNNITAIWLRGVTDKVYDDAIKGMVATQNYNIAHGVDVKLVEFHEDDKDREILAKLFTMTVEEQAAVDEQISKADQWCQEQAPRLLDVMPAPHPGLAEELPTIPNPTPLQLSLLEYQPLVDFTQLKGESAADAREAMRLADAAIANSRGTDKPFEGFRVEDLPRPNTHPDMPHVDIVPYPLSLKDVPVYEPLTPQKATRWPIDAVADPFQRPFLHLPDFHETAMPEFEGTAGFGSPRPSAPQAAKEEWLSRTMSIFSDNNPDDGKNYGWGLVPPRGRLMPPFIDEPYLPPSDIVQKGGGGKRLMLRGIWDPELLTQDDSDPAGGPAKSRMVPPLRDRGRELYTPPAFEHPDAPLWSANLAPPKTRGQKVRDMIPLIPVKSFAKFKPNKITADLPDFLWELARQDAAGQGLWDVIEQRHAIPREFRAEREAADARLEAARAAEREAVERSMAAEEVVAQPAEEEVAQLAEQPLALPAPEGVEAEARRTVQAEQRHGELPVMEVDAPEVPMPPALSAAATAPRPASSAGGPLEAPQTPQAPKDDPNAAGSESPSLAAGAAGREAVRRETLEAHKERVRELSSMGVSPGGAGETRGVEQLLADDRFIDSIADRIASRLGATAGTLTTGALSPSATQASWMAGLQTGTTTLAGHPTAVVARPDPPSFAEPADERSRAKLPRALLGGEAAKQGAQGGAGGAPPAAAKEPTTVSDVNHFTQEKMRGECYVRLLIHPEANAARKVPQPYLGDTVNPDAALVAGPGRPNLVMPAKAPVVNDAGEMEEDDEFADFERNDTVVFSFVRHNRYEAVEALLAQETDTLGAKDENGNNLLHVACQNNNRHIAKLLIRNGISVNEQNNKGNTPLHYCSQYGFMQLADYLLAHGAEDTILNKVGLLPSQGLGAEKDGVASGQKQLQTDLAQ